MTQDHRFAEAIDGLRRGRNLSQAELARNLDVSENDVSRWLRGRGISIKNVRKLADYFGVERTWLEDLAGYAANSAPATEPIAIELQARLTRMGTVLSGYPRPFWLAVLSAIEQLTDALATQAGPPVSALKRGRVSAPIERLTPADAVKRGGLTSSKHALHALLSLPALALGDAAAAL